MNAAVSFVGGKRAGNNPWNALTLEWTTSSPPPEHNFDTDPVPAPDPYGYGTPMAAAYLAGERDLVALNAIAHAGGGHAHATVESVAGGDK